MAFDLNTETTTCSRCGAAYAKRKGVFPSCYAGLYKGVGNLHICKNCVEQLYNNYLSQCNDAKKAVRQMCRKLDLYWNENIFDSVYAKGSTRTLMSQYLARINAPTHIGRTYDDTLAAEGTLWSFDSNMTDGIEQAETVVGEEKVIRNDAPYEVPEEVVKFWGPGYTPSMYRELEERRQIWMAELPKDVDRGVGTQALIRQICALELDINRDRAEGKSVDKNVTTLNTLLGSANLKPDQSKPVDVDNQLANTPMGVWLYKYEQKRPLPEVDEDLKDVNRLRRYVFTWMLGHLCKMLGLKNTYSQMYEEEVSKLRVEKPEYDGDDDEAFLSAIMDGGGEDE